MPDESCRKCGFILHDLHKCAECNKVVSMICKNCGKKTEAQFHIDCLFSEFGKNSDIWNLITCGNYSIITAV